VKSEIFFIKRLQGLYLVFVLAVILFPHSAKAQEIRAKDVVITATRTEQELRDVPSTVSVISEEKIKEAPASTIADLLQDVPGVEVFDQSVPGAKRVQIRGESGARVLILIDGQKISEQKSMDGAAILIDPNRIERLEVVKGPASILYGSEAIGGVVNIITKKGGDKPISLETSLTYDSSTDGLSEYLSVFGGLDGFSYRVSGTYSDQGNRHTPSGALGDTSYMSRDTSVFLGYDWAKASLGVSYDEYWSNINSMTPEGTIGDTLYNFDLDLPLWERKKTSGFFEVRDLTSYLSRLRMDVFHQDVTKEMVNIIGVRPSSVMTIDQHQRTKNKQESWGGSFQVDILPHVDHYLILGYDLGIDDLDAVTTVEQTVRRTVPMPVSTTTTTRFDYDALATSHAIYLQDEWSLPADFTLTLGARQTWVKSELSDTNNPTLETESRTDAHPVFSAGLTWQGLPDTTLRLLFSQGYRFPNLQQLYIGTVHGGADPTYPNPDLEPETSNNYEAGVRYNNGRWNLDLGVFMSRAKDYITTQPVTGGNQFTNVDAADSHGAELFLGYTFEDYGLTPYSSATWLKRRYRTGSYDTWDTGHPEFMGRVGLRYDHDLAEQGVGLFADLFVRAASDADQRVSDGSTETYKSWQTLNLSLGAKFGNQRQHYLSLNFLNVLNRSYTTAANTLEEPGAHAVLTVGFSF